ncbi:uncharacterized protein LOC107459923 [Arachis duranensis]|uniref:Uncharacterized protein LOC107459923 n=1 Tax=Arachis duranensis TaxID=130453 RepID=A0A6P4B4B8_ARADU|nr:uncharacterized protein LOC107459923 [Arachis duranensis]XP_025610993.1 uncharacterized protein LOC112703655 [Arachis hypogaea]
MEVSNRLEAAMTNITVDINVHVFDNFYFVVRIPISLVKNLLELFISVILAAVILYSLRPVIQYVRGLLGRSPTWWGSRSLTPPVFTRGIWWHGHNSTGQESTGQESTSQESTGQESTSQASTGQASTPPPSTACTPFRGPALKRKGVALFLRMRMDT